MLKRILTMVLTVIMIIGTSTTVFAAEGTAAYDVEIPVTYFDNVAEYNTYLNELAEISRLNSTRGATVMSASVIRSGTSDDCELYLNWTGDEMYSSFRFKKMTVKSTSILFAETFGTFGDGSNYTTKKVVAASVGSVKIGDVTIDSGVDKVKVNSSGLQGYNMKSASWLSAVEFTGTVTIN